jgi:hypothetical protein
VIVPDVGVGVAEQGIIKSFSLAIAVRPISVASEVVATNWYSIHAVT